MVGSAESRGWSAKAPTTSAFAPPSSRRLRSMGPVPSACDLLAIWPELTAEALDQRSRLVSTGWGCFPGRLGWAPGAGLSWWCLQVPPHLPGWLGHWQYAALAPQVPLAELPTTAPETRPPDGGWRARARGARRPPPGPARRSLAPRPAPFRLVWPRGRMRAACAGCREPLNRRSSLVTTYTHDSLRRVNRGG